MMKLFRLALIGFLGAVLFWPIAATAQTFVCPSGPGPGERQVGVTGGSGGVAVIPICASNGEEVSSDYESVEPHGPEWDTRWGAIARGKAGGWGAVGDMLSEKSAAAAALKQCKATASTKVADCKVTITYYNQCVVYVWGSAGGVSSSAIDIPTANERAMARCRETSSDCELLYSNCSYGRQIN
jgi:hypothetical protein